MEQDLLVSESSLRKFTEDIFLKMGCSDEDAQLAADVLLLADLRGIDSHGVARLSGYYRLFEAGRINPKPKIKITRETLSTLRVDADSALGLVAAPKIMKLLVEKAKKAGSAWAAIGNSNHFGIAAYHALIAANQEMIGYASTNASPLVSPTYSKERLLGTNPVCYCIPANPHPPVVMDLATSAAANGKLEIAQRLNKDVPQGWIADKNGLATTNPNGVKEGGSLLPLGSDKDRGSHKGYALGAMVDIFSGVLSGANYGPWVPPFVSFLPVLPDLPGKGLGHFMGCWDIEAFVEKEEFYHHMNKWINRFKNSESIENHKVIIPGEPEQILFEERKKSGIPLNSNVVKDLEKLAQSVQVNFI